MHLFLNQEASEYLNYDIGEQSQVYKCDSINEVFVKPQLVKRERVLQEQFPTLKEFASTSMNAVTPVPSKSKHRRQDIFSMQVC